MQILRSRHRVVILALLSLVLFFLTVVKNNLKSAMHGAIQVDLENVNKPKEPTKPLRITYISGHAGTVSNLKHIFKQLGRSFETFDPRAHSFY
jgi:uncharacterized alpha/beta hydrolase family protein